MSETAPETTAAAPPAPPAGHDGSTGERLSRVEDAVERIEHAIERLVPGSHAEAQQREEQRLDRPSNVAEQVRAELARARQEEADQATAQAQREQEETTQQRLARLEEAKPLPPDRRATKLLGWGDGRS